MLKEQTNSSTVGLSKFYFARKRFNKNRVLISKLKRKILKNKWLARTLIILAACVLLILIIFLGSRLITNSKIPSSVKLAYNFVFAPKSQIKSINDRVNILVMGKGGEGHDAPDLTDTMIFVSVSLDKPNLYLISVPRDIWMPDLKDKINSAYFYGKQNEKNSGLVLAKSVTEEVVGEPIQYSFVIDFSGFVKIIDEIGGINVDVQSAFTDNQYPVAGKENDNCNGDPTFACRYETISFQKGSQVMNGQRALEFVRSRHAEGDNGTDFARSTRQRLVIQAIFNKIMTKNIILNPSKIKTLFQILKENSETDLSAPEAAVILRDVTFPRKNVSSSSIPIDLLNIYQNKPEYNNLYVLVPKDGNWTEVHKWVEDFLSKNSH